MKPPISKWVRIIWSRLTSRKMSASSSAAVLKKPTRCGAAPATPWRKQNNNHCPALADDIGDRTGLFSCYRLPPVRFHFPIHGDGNVSVALNIAELHDPMSLARQSPPHAWSFGILFDRLVFAPVHFKTRHAEPFLS